MDIKHVITTSAAWFVRAATRTGVPARHRAAGPVRAVVWHRGGGRPAPRHVAVPVGPSRVLLRLGLVLCGAGLACGVVNASLVWGSAGSAVPQGITPWAGLAAVLVIAGAVCLMGQEGLERGFEGARLGDVLDEAADARPGAPAGAAGVGEAA